MEELLEILRKHILNALELFVLCLFYGMSPYGTSPSTNALVSSKVAEGGVFLKDEGTCLVRQ